MPSNNSMNDPFIEHRHELQPLQCREEAAGRQQLVLLLGIADENLLVDGLVGARRDGLYRLAVKDKLACLERGAQVLGDVPLAELIIRGAVHIGDSKRKGVTTDD